MRTRTSLCLALAVLVAGPAAALAAARAELRPGPRLSAGAPAELSIIVDGAAERPATPHIAGASVRFAGQASQTQIINGHASQQTRFVYSLVPQQTGALDIPAITVGASTTEPLHATVSTGAAPTAASRHDEPRAASEPSHAFLTVDVPTKSLVVGQAVPIKIHAWFRGGTSATLQGVPHVTSDAYTLADLSDKPVQSQRELHGVPYLEATWTAVLSPAKPSTGKLTVELPVELVYRTAAPRRAPQPHRSLRDVFGADPFGDDLFGGDPFADAFFDQADPFADMDSMFDVGPMQRVETTLRASAGPIAAMDVPTTGRPAGFSGAVGTFTLALDPIAGEARVGEPLTITFKVSGTGNFDRVAFTGLSDGSGFKAYPVKGTFEPGTRSNTGTKTFTQTIVPTQDGELKLPALAFAFFDPSKNAFATSSVTPQPLQVERARGGGVADAGLAASVRDPAMVPNRLDPGPTHATLVPLFRHRGFWLVPAALAFLTALVSLVGWARRSERVARRREAHRAHRTVARAEAEMRRAATVEDRAAFFLAARRALQARLATSWHTAPDAITAHDVQVRLGDRGENIRAVFERADGVAYGGAAGVESLDHWSHVVHDELATLEVSP